MQQDIPKITACNCMGCDDSASGNTLLQVLILKQNDEPCTTYTVIISPRKQSNQQKTAPDERDTRRDEYVLGCVHGDILPVCLFARTNQELISGKNDTRESSCTCKRRQAPQKVEGRYQWSARRRLRLRRQAAPIRRLLPLVPVVFSGSI
jgi:hypothetical protein